MSDLLSGQIHFTGLGSGTDFDTLITKLVDVERTHIRRLQSWRGEWSDKVDSFQELNRKLLALRTTLSSMDSRSKFLIKTTASTNPAQVSAAAGSEAAEGSYQVLVNQLARNDIWTHRTGELSLSENIAGSTDQTFVYTYQGVTTTVAVPSGTTLEGLVDLINKDGGNPGVRASTIFSGQSYHLQVRGMDLGRENAVIIGDHTLGGYGSADFENSQQAASAQLRVDGFPSTGWIERDTNTISDVIPGLTLSLRTTTGESAVTVTVGRDDEAIKEQVRTFVSQVNEVLALIREQTKVDATTKTGSVLTGNYGVQIIQQKLKLILAGKGLGLDYDRDPFINLSSVGITTDANEGSPTRGELLLDESALQAALDRDADALAALFSASFSVLTDSADFAPASQPYVPGVTRPGSYAVAYEIDASGSIASATIGGVAATIDTAAGQITGSDGAVRGLSLIIRNTAPGSYTGMVYLQQGKTGELMDQIRAITDSRTGTLHILENNYQSIMDNIDDKIAYEEARIARLERDLRQRFARLEALLGYYDQLTVYMTSQIKAFSPESK
jgi:flagellar hook-associated protein 2